MTGLSVNTKEPLIVQHFGVGGPIFSNNGKNSGKKLAMILFYVSGFFSKHQKNLVYIHENDNFSEEFLL
jgi:hypothetical protein